MLTLYDSALIQTEAKKVGILQVIPKTDGRSVIETIKSLLQKIPVRDVNIAEVPTNHPQLASEQCGAASSDHQAAEDDYALG